jgi:hypothetical protein
MAAVTGAALLAAVPKWLWALAAGLYGAHEVAKMGEMYGQYSLGKKQIAAGLKGQEFQAAIGKREERRMNELITQLLAMRTKERTETRELDLLKMLTGGTQQQSLLATTLMQAVGQRPVGTGYVPPSNSMVSLLR